MTTVMDMYKHELDRAGLMICQHCLCELKITKLSSHLLKCPGYKAELRRLQARAGMRAASTWPKALLAQWGV